MEWYEKGSKGKGVRKEKGSEKGSVPDNAYFGAIALVFS